MNEAYIENITVKSIAGNRIRLKSDIFKSKKNIELIKEQFGESFSYFRENIYTSLFKVYFSQLQNGDILDVNRRARTKRSKN